MSYQGLKIEQLDEGTILKVTLSRPKRRNALSWNTMAQFGDFFKKVNSHPTARVVVVVGDGPLFCSGLDLKEAGQVFQPGQGVDVARDVIAMDVKIKTFQQYFLAIHECRVPVLMGAHSRCLGAGVDFFSASDMRFCTSDCKFSIKQIDLGLATDIGSLQFFPKYTGNSSTFKELIFTGREFDGKEAKRLGYVSKIFDSKEQMHEELIKIAKDIASKSPVAIYTIKKTILNGEKDIREGFQFIRKLNSSMLMSKDFLESFTAYIEKRKPVFPKL